MLSIQPIKNATDAQHYYIDTDNYYLSDKAELEKSTRWAGKGANVLRLSGQVMPEPFLQLLKGTLPHGQQLGIVIDGELKHRPGTDITLSAPKSVSILALVGGDMRLLEAHNLAVKETLDCIEHRAAEARVTFNKETHFENTHNLVIARFQHTTSRELDPQLHDHCIILNMTQRADGAWRALSSRSKQDKTHLNNGFREILYDNQHYFGLIYTSTLAKKTRELGYDIEVKDRYGNFEIASVPNALIEQASKRRTQIMRRLAERGLSSAKAAEKATLDTRRLKEEVDSQSLHAYWQKEAKAQGVDLEALILSSQSIKKGTISAPRLIQVSDNALLAVNDALEHLAPFNTQIKHADLVRQAFLFAAGHIAHDEIEQVIGEKMKNKQLLGKELEYYTTDELLRQEKNFIKQFKASFGASFSIECKQFGLASDVLRKKDRVQLIDVNGLTHEKHLINDLVDTAEEQGLKAYVLHIGRLQANRLGDCVSRDTSSVWKWLKNIFKEDLVHTVASFTTRYECGLKNPLIVVHDAQKVSYEDLSRLEKITVKSRGKLILLNNTRSTEGFSAGSPLKALKDAGFHAAVSTSRVNSAVFDIVQTSTIHQALASYYVSLSLDEQQQTKVIALTNKDQLELTQQIRQGLKESGVLSIQSKSVVVLSTQTLSQAQKKHTQFYEVGDAVTLNSYTHEQAHYRVLEIKENAIQIEDKYGKQHEMMLSASQSVQVTKNKTLELSVGDRLVTERSIFLKKAKIERSSTFQVQAINPEGVFLNYNNKRLYFSNDELADLCLSHDYVRKPSQLTDKAERALIALSANQINKNALAELAELTPTIRLFTHDAQKAKQALDKKQISWTIADVAFAKPSLLYRDSQYVNAIIHKDLEYLAQALCKKDKALNPEYIAELAVAYATAKLGEREAGFKHQDLLMHALRYALGDASQLDIEKAIHKQAVQGELVHAGTYWVTAESLRLEKEIIAMNQQEQEKLLPITTPAQLLSLPLTFTQGQKDAISLALTTRNRFVSIQGLAGVGKTTMMQELQRIAKSEGFNTLGLAPTHQAKLELRANGIESMTVERFLLNESPFEKNTIFIVDESSMIGNQQYVAIQKRVIDLNARAVFTGDMTQLQSIVSGIPHELTVSTGTQKTAFMQEILRQNLSLDLKKAVMHALSRDITRSFEQLETINPEQYVKRNPNVSVYPTTSVIEINGLNQKTKRADYSKLYEAIASDYLTRIPEHQQKTLVIAHTHEDRHGINTCIRNGLKEQGVIQKEEVSCVRLMSKSLDKVDLLEAKNYQPGDVLRFGRDFSVAKKGEYFTVLRCDVEKNKLVCHSSTKDTLTINPAKIAMKSGLSVYTAQQSSLAVGDRIRLRLTDERRGHIANTEYIVNSIDQAKAWLIHENESLEIKLTEQRDSHWDYAYTNTAFSIQGATSNFILALELSTRTQATNHRSHEIDISRASTQATIYTDNKKNLVARLSNPSNQSKIDKTSAYRLREAAKHQQPNQSAHDVNLELTHKIERLAYHLLGEPNQQLSSASELRYGKKGSLSINLNNGLWTSFETGEKGNALQLISTQLGFHDFKDTLSYAKDFLSLKEEVLIKQLNAGFSKPKTQVGNNKTDYAKKLVEQSLPIEGTLAEIYLKNYRKVNHFANADLRFLPKISTLHGSTKIQVPALLAIARNNEGEVNHVQVIRLNPTTGDKDRKSTTIKQTYGSINGCVVDLNKNSTSKTTYLVEGVETGLSILEDDQEANVLVVLGKSNFKNVALEKLTTNVILCLDNDGQAKANDPIIREAVKRLVDAKKDVSIVMPRREGYDFNDVLKKEGVSSLKTQLSEAVHLKPIFLQRDKDIKAINTMLSIAVNIHKSANIMEKELR